MREGATHPIWTDHLAVARGKMSATISLFEKLSLVEQEWDYLRLGMSQCTSSCVLSFLFFQSFLLISDLNLAREEVNVSDASEGTRKLNDPWSGDVPSRPVNIHFPPVSFQHVARGLSLNRGHFFR